MAARRSSIGSRTLHLREDELLSTFLVRSAHHNGLEPWRYCNLLWPGVAIWTRDPDRSTNARWLAAVAVRLDIAPTRLRDATLFDLQTAMGATRPGRLPTVLTLGIHHRARHHHGLQYCPDCLAEHPLVYRRAWRSTLSVRCPIHGRSLRDACPHCDAPLAPHRNRRLNWDLCDACRGYLVHGPKDDPVQVPGRVAALQDALVADLLHAVPDAVADARDLRVLLGILASTAPTDRLAAALSLPAGAGTVSPAGVFEHRRLPQRIAALNLAAAWRADWPMAFRAGAAAMGLTQRSFAAWRPGPMLRLEVERLPVRAGRPRAAPVPRIHTALLRRLARTDPALYRAARAAKFDRLTRR